jgi:hypothetical protein
MSLTGSVALDFIIGIILSVVITVGGTIALLFITAFVWTKIDEFFSRW